jgi:hypothetical protein
VETLVKYKHKIPPMTTTQEIAKNVFLNTKKMETNGADGAHTIYIYTVKSIYSGNL